MLKESAMKKFVVCFLLSWGLLINTAMAQLVKEDDPLKKSLIYLGVVDYPPFSSYTTYQNGAAIHTKHVSAFIKPIQNALKSAPFSIKQFDFSNQKPELEKHILLIRSGEVQLFLGAYANTKLFTGTEMIYPASVSNPVHIITLPDTQEKIKSKNDLSKLKGTIIESEYFSDFVMRKIKPLNLAVAKTPYDAYEALFTGETDYIIGGMFYNKMMSSKYGIEQYLAYSTKPLFNMPVFIAISKLSPLFSLYHKHLSTQFAKPSFAKEVKEEILRMVEEEIAKNQGVVPPAFAKKVQEEQTATKEVLPEKEELRGSIVNSDKKPKSIDDILDELEGGF